MAPEFLTDKVFTSASDVYSFGILMYEIVFEKEPYPGLQGVQVLFQVSNKALRPEFPSAKTLSPLEIQLTYLMQACW